CRACRGAGCAVCGGTGRTHEESVEDLLGGPLAESFRAARAVLHGMGREDVDARTLGRGRPFVVELSEPRSRKVDLAAAARATSERSRERVAVSPLRVVPAEVVARLKALDPPKRYRALVKVGAPVEPERVHALEGTFRGAEIRQRTPERVLRRRADKVRPRRVLELRAALLPGGALELLVVAEAGTYVKELVSGDSGRTAPSVAEALGVAASVVELDVLEILVEDEEVLGAPRASDRRE
ncbi:tRNA pseudouridine(54/55) synthase Pus10, partial [bacterium]|nr:tRNA pseudouridine(54/55) synthase Pus10 [bacterium]